MAENQWTFFDLIKSTNKYIITCIYNNKYTKLLYSLTISISLWKVSIWQDNTVYLSQGFLHQVLILIRALEGEVKSFFYSFYANSWLYTMHGAMIEVKCLPQKTEHSKIKSWTLDLSGCCLKKTFMMCTFKMKTKLKSVSRRQSCKILWPINIDAIFWNP